VRTAPALALLVTVTMSACSGGGERAETRSATAEPVHPERSRGALAGPRAEAEFWTATLDAPKVFRAGEQAAARVRITARGGYHVNLDYPLAFIPGADATADFASARVALTPSERSPCDGHPGDVCALAADVAFVPRDAAALRVAGTVAFSVCTAERCLIEKAALAVTAP
jgi:hypothetical protein